MTVLPEPKPTATAAGQATPTDAEREMIRRLMAAVDEIPSPTSYNDPDLPSHKDGPQIGDTAPVPQPDSRIVPAWALGLAVGSIGVGAGSIGLGCAVWLVCKGLSSVIHSLSSVTLTGVLVAAAPFAGAAMLATAIGGAISKSRTTNITNIRNGPTHEEHHTITSRSIWNTTKNINPK